MWVSFAKKLSKHSRLHLGIKITPKNFWYCGIIVLFCAMMYYCVLGMVWLFFGMFWLMWQIAKWSFILIRRGIRALSRSGSQSDELSSAASKLSVAGVYYYTKNLESVCIPNPFYSLSPDKLAQKFPNGKRIYKYKRNGYTAELEEEPTNPHDPNAIKVLISGQIIGHIPREMCTSVKKQMRRNKVHSVPAVVSGGRYKVLDSEDGFITSESSFSVEIELPFRL